MKSLFLLFTFALFENILALEYDRSITPEQRRIIQRDLENLCRLNYDLRGGKIETSRRIMQVVFEIEELAWKTSSVDYREF